MADQGLLINSIEMVEIDGSVNVPTLLYYRRGKGPAIGAEALTLKESRRQLNEEFKIDLGNARPGTVGERNKFSTASGDMKSAQELTADFLHEILVKVKEWLGQRESNVAPGIMIAEPLSLTTETTTALANSESKDGQLVTKDWLQQYRSNLRRILQGKGFSEDSIQFLPEPFAVFQYYRHGKKHPIVADRRQHNALVIDFGGGTFDVCIIETTKEGEIDINDAKRLSRPRSAASKPIGGFFINRTIVETLLEKHLAQRNLTGKLHKGLDLYRRWRRGDLRPEEIAEDYKYFILNFHSLSHDIEEAKIALCKSISDWRLDVPLSASVPVTVPANPFSPEASMNFQLTAQEFRNVFVHRIWEQQLRDIVRLALDRGKQELNGAPITVVLLSGGSANIRWLKELLRRDFAAALTEADILELRDYQEVVSKGLAVECVRRFYEPDGDFASTTYNRLCLVLDADKSGQKLKQFQPRQPGLPVSDLPGVLLPSSSALGRFAGQPMRWKVRLDKHPSQILDYYFLRSSFNPNDVSSLQNMEEHTAFTPRHCRFDQQMQVELTVSEDGTASPRFIYKTGRDESETISVQTRPFYLDMTVGHAEASQTSYIGLDFGTSNSSVSFVNRSAVEVYEKRSNEKHWNDLSGLSYVLPYPLATSLANYLRSDPTRSIIAAREFAETALAIAAYFSFLEYCTIKRSKASFLFKGFTQRSAGPLWALLKEITRSKGKELNFCAPLSELTTSPLLDPLDRFVSQIAQEKHGKVDAASVDTSRPVQILANVLQKMFASVAFGLFQNVQQERFGPRFRGIFRHAVGQLPYFGVVSEYSGTTPFAQDSGAIVQGQLALRVEPLMFWNRCAKHPDHDSGHFYFYDSVDRSGAYSFKAAGSTCTCLVSANSEFGPLAKALDSFRLADPKIEPVRIDRLKLADAESVSTFA